MLSDGKWKDALPPLVEEGQSVQLRCAVPSSLHSKLEAFELEASAITLHSKILPGFYVASSKQQPF